MILCFDAMVTSDQPSTPGLSAFDAALKRSFDFLFALLGLVVLGWLILAAYIIATIDTRQNGFFIQERVGRYGKLFKVIKIRTMRDDPRIQTSVTRSGDPRITSVGAFFRKTKIDELPQLFNVLIGKMSFVGPRPDVPGFADFLTGADKIILTVRPGITGPATLQFRHEEDILAQQSDPEHYNLAVIYPEKVRLNRDYVEDYGFLKDIRYIWYTIFGG